MNTGRVAWLSGAIAIAAAIWAAPASAATLIGDYQFQGTRASSGPGPELAAVNDFGTFPTESVMGTSRQVDAFAEGGGLRMEPTGLTGTTHSVVMTFRLLDDTGYNRILDWSHGTSDNGIYDHARKAYYFRPMSEAAESTNPVLGSNTYSTVAVTSADSGTRVFVNGSPVINSQFHETFIGNALTFFVDNTSGGFTGEQSAGAASCIRVYSGVLTDAEITAIGASPDCTAKPAQAQPPGALTQPTQRKKCKKHKKKHRAAEAKKKCKKKKKH